LYQLQDPNKIKPRGEEVLVKFCDKKKAGKIIVPESAKMADNDPFPFCEIIAVGPQCPDDIKKGDLVGVAVMHWNAGHFGFKPKGEAAQDYALVDQGGIVAWVDDAMKEVE
jgi:co-chaperonin GroES (HSP10)